MIHKLILRRTKYSPEQTEGHLFVHDLRGNPVFECFTLELPWKDNIPHVSCIPVGEYKVVPRTSPKYGDHLHILDVPGRSLILIHQANYVDQLLGCIAVGRSRADLNGDGLQDITASVATKNDLLRFITGPTTIKIL